VLRWYHIAFLTAISLALVLFALDELFRII
jgi:hypothetical protein